jgi:uncharacterized protein (TIGR02444 family)
MSADLWTWANRVYAAPGVADACLTLQDRFGLDVNVLLWSAWRQTTGAPADRNAVRAAMTAIRPLQADIVGPLRAIRRQVKGLSAAGLYETLKAAELEAERLILERLAAQPAGPASGETGLAAVARSAGADPAVPALAAALAGLARALAPVAQAALDS